MQQHSVNKPLNHCITEMHSSNKVICSNELSFQTISAVLILILFSVNLPFAETLKSHVQLH